MPQQHAAGLYPGGAERRSSASALIWYVWWLAGLSLVGDRRDAIRHSFNYKRDFHIPAEDVTAAEDARTRSLAALEG